MSVRKKSHATNRVQRQFYDKISGNTLKSLRISNQLALRTPCMNQPEFIDPAETIAGQQREKSRESIFLGAQIVIEGARVPISARVRNISPGGMMVDAQRIYDKGLAVTATIKGIGDVTGRIAWSTSNRCGIAFDELVDPLLARQPVSSGTTTTTYKRPFVPDRRPGLAIR